MITVTAELIANVAVDIRLTVAVSVSAVVTRAVTVTSRETRSGFRLGGETDQGDSPDGERKKGGFHRRGWGWIWFEPCYRLRKKDDPLLLSMLKFLQPLNFLAGTDQVENQI